MLRKNRAACFMAAVAAGAAMAQAGVIRAPYDTISADDYDVSFSLGNSEITVDSTSYGANRHTATISGTQGGDMRIMNTSTHTGVPFSFVNVAGNDKLRVAYANSGTNSAFASIQNTGLAGQDWKQSLTFNIDAIWTGATGTDTVQLAFGDSDQFHANGTANFAGYKGQVTRLGTTYSLKIFKDLAPANTHVPLAEVVLPQLALDTDYTLEFSGDVQATADPLKPNVNVTLRALRNSDGFELGSTSWLDTGALSPGYAYDGFADDGVAGMLPANFFGFKVTPGSSADIILIDDYHMEVVPEPASLGLAGLAAGSLLLRRRQRA